MEDKMPSYVLEDYWSNLSAYIRMEYMAEYKEITPAMKDCFLYLWSKNTPIPNAAFYFHNSFRSDYTM
jgi:hypothetical protein